MLAAHFQFPLLNRLEIPYVYTRENVIWPLSQFHKRKKEKKKVVIHCLASFPMYTTRGCYLL